MDLLVEKLSSKLEEKLLLCNCCKGLLRDACLCEEELRCRVCIPEGVAWQPVKMNREIVHERKVIVCYTNLSSLLLVFKLHISCSIFPVSDSKY